MHSAPLPAPLPAEAGTGWWGIRVSSDLGVTRVFWLRIQDRQRQMFKYWGLYGLRHACTTRRSTRGIR